MERQQLKLASHPDRTLSAVGGQRQQVTLEDVRAQYRDLTTRPYDPAQWLKHADFWLRWRYLELGVGAAWKATRLCETLHRHCRQGAGKWRLGLARGFWMMTTEGEQRREDEGEAQAERVLEEEKALLATLRRVCHAASDVLEMVLTADSGLLEGLYERHDYFWMDERFRQRSDALLRQINRELKESVSGSIPGEFCEVRRHAFGNAPGSQEVLGLFATRPISAGSEIIEDESTTWACDHPSTTRDLERDSEGSPKSTSAQGCMIASHNASLEPAFDLVRRRAGPRASEVIVRFQFLRAALTDRVPHPLDHHLLARLAAKPLRSDAAPRMLRLHPDITLPNTLLQAHGVDIFADGAWATEILMTVAERVRNNHWADPLHMCVHPLFSLLNHSCEPNVNWASRRADVRILHLTALRDIRAGEQLFVEYDGFEADSGLRRRRRMMRRWLTEDCMCTRCVREEAQLQSFVGGGSEDAGSQSGEAGAGGRRDGRAAWDQDRADVLFPEDGRKSRGR